MPKKTVIYFSRQDIENQSTNLSASKVSNTGIKIMLFLWTTQ